MRAGPANTFTANITAYKEKTDLNKITHIIRHIRNNHPIELKYDKGTIVIDGNINTPYSVYDPRIDKNRALARHYQDITCFLEKNNQDYTDNVKDYIDCPIQGKTNDTNALRDYQKDALESWLSQNKKGCIVLPTGAGKDNNRDKGDYRDKFVNSYHSAHDKFNGTVASVP